MSSPFSYPDPIDDPWASLLAEDAAPTSEGSVYPPRALMLASLLVVAGCWLLFLAGSKAAHWAGYGLGVAATSVIVLAYRHELLRRRRQRLFVDKPAWNRIVAIAMPVGIVSGFVHVWFALSEQRVR